MPRYIDAEAVKKALECCQFRHIKKNCDECKYHRWIEPACRDLICQDALALITSQEQRIGELTEENERLRANEKSATEILNFKFAYDAGKADTVRKMQTLIEEKADSCDICLINSHKPIDIIYQISKKQLDQIAKELEGE